MRALRDVGFLSQIGRLHDTNSWTHGIRKGGRLLPAVGVRDGGEGLFFAAPVAAIA